MGVDILNRQVILSGCVPSECETTANMIATNSVKRSLFGPVDHQEAMSFFQKELAKMEQEKMKEWNFDFANEKPLRGNFRWEKVEDGKRSSKTPHRPAIIRNTTFKVTNLKSPKKCSLKSLKTSLPVRIHHDNRQTTITGE